MFLFRTKFGICQVLNSLKQRNLMYQSTTQEIPINGSVYCGFDPTAQSLHLGNLVSILNLVRLQQFGFQPIAILGGATVQLGDPSGRKEEKQQLSFLEIEKNTKNIEKQIIRIYKNINTHLNKSEQQQLIILNNVDFYKDQNIIQFVGEVGRKLRMNSLLGKDHIKQRLNDPLNGLSLTEFFYTIIQSYDFFYLNEKYNCTLQIGGSDQWGNITNGCDFIKRCNRNQVHGITTPLLLDKSGNKFGKSEGNAIWLDEELTKINDIRQYILNLPDDSIDKYLKMLTFLSLEEIEKIMIDHNIKPELRLAQQILSDQLIAMIHGLQDVGNKNKILFETQNYTDLSLESLQNIMNQVDRDIMYNISKDNNIKLIDLMVQLKLRESKAEIRRLINAGGLYINGNKTQLIDIDTNDYNKNKLFGKYMVMRFGKREFRIFQFQ